MYRLEVGYCGESSDWSFVKRSVLARTVDSELNISEDILFRYFSFAVSYN